MCWKFEFGWTYDVDYTVLVPKVCFIQSQTLEQQNISKSIKLSLDILYSFEFGHLVDEIMFHECYSKKKPIDFKLS